MTQQTNAPADDAGERVERYLSGRFQWAAPGDQQEDAWLVRFCDKDCAEAIFTGPDAEREAWQHWNRYAPSYNIYVFRLAAISPEAKPADVEGVEQAFIEGWRQACISVAPGTGFHVRDRIEALAEFRAERPAQAEGVENSPPVLPGERWIERWCGSGMWRGSSIWTTDSLGCHKNLVEHLGGDEETHAAVRRIVSAHNATLSQHPEPSPPAAGNCPDCQSANRTRAILCRDCGHLSTPQPAPKPEAAGLMERALATFNHGIVRVPDEANPRGFVDRYDPQEAMRRVLQAITTPTAQERE